MSLHYKQINRVKNEIDGQPSILSAFMKVSDYRTAFTPMHFVFLELDKHHCQLSFKFLCGHNYGVITSTFYLHIIYDNNTSKIYPYPNPMTTPEQKAYRLKKIN